MEFAEVVDRRRMVRDYSDAPVDPRVVDRALRAAVRAPNAGFSQGWGFVVLDQPEDVARWWRTTTDDVAAPDRWLRGMMRAPVVILPCSDKSAYLARYAEPDKAWDPADESRWAMPYWHLDTAMASLLILLTAVDEGLGACFFAIPVDRLAAVRRAYAIPEQVTPVGAITVGHPAAGSQPSGSPRRRVRRPLADIVHRGRWTATLRTPSTTTKPVQPPPP